MRVLVTGASGQLGLYVQRALGKHGAEVIAWAGASAVNLTDRDAITRALDAAMPDVVVHLAAVATPAAALRAPERAPPVILAERAQPLTPRANSRGCANNATPG